MAVYKLVQIDDLGNVSNFPLTKSLTSIGRAKTNDIVLLERSVSAFHAKIRVDDDRIGIKDFDSTNGTFVNDRRITKPTALRSGDEIIIGENRFHVECEDDELAASTRVFMKD